MAGRVIRTSRPRGAAVVLWLGLLLVACLSISSTAAASTVTAIRRVSVNGDGKRVLGSSYGPYVSSSGELVAFTSLADLDGEGTPATPTAYVRNMTTGQVERVASGTVIGLSSEGTYLAVADANELGFHVYDLQTGTAVEVPLPDTNGGNTALLYGASMSANGRYLVFATVTPNPGEPDAGHVHIIVNDLETHTEEQVPDPDTNWEWPTISDDGRYIAFQPAESLHPVVVIERGTGAVVFDPSGYGASFYQLPRISPDGTHVVFSASPSARAGSTDVYVGTIATGEVVDLTPNETGYALDNGNWDATGRYVSFSTPAPLVAFDTNARRDVYVYDTAAKTATLASMDPDGTLGENNSGNDSSTGVGYGTSALSANAASVVFNSDAGNLVPEENSGVEEFEETAGGSIVHREDVYEASIGEGEGDVERAAAPEFGRCVEASHGAGTKPTYHGDYTDASCEKPSTTESGRYEWLPGVVKRRFSTEAQGSTTITLETSGGAKVVCGTEHGTGEYTGPKAVGGFAVTLGGCELVEDKARCASAGAAAGEIVTEPLDGVLGVDARGATVAKNKIGLDLRPEMSAGPIAEFTCGAATVSVKGSVVVPLTAGKMLTTTSLKAAESKGKQKPEHLVEGPTDVLEESIDGASAERAGLKATLAKTDEEAIEINTVV